MKRFLIGMIIFASISWSSMYARIGPEQGDFNLIPGIDYQPGEVLVKLIPALQPENPAIVLQEYRLGLLAELPKLGWYVMAIPEETDQAVPQMVARLKEDSRVEYVTPNYIRHPNWQPNDAYYQSGHLWHFDVIGMPEAWDLDTEPPLYGGDPSVVVAVIDTGGGFWDHVDTTSYVDDNGNPITVTFAKLPDFENANIWRNEAEIKGQENPVPDGIDDDANGYVDDFFGYNWPNANGFPCDDNEHGTHVSGTIIESTNNDSGEPEEAKAGAGMAFNCTLMMLKTGAREGGSVMEDVAAAIIYATDNGADIINMSLGSGYVGQGPPISAEYEACVYAAEHGVMIYASTGNDADTGMWGPEMQGVGYPSGYPSVVGVGASQNATVTGDPMSESPAPYSQYGYTLEILAPGGDYMSGDRDGSGKDDMIWQQTIRPRDFPNLTLGKMKGFSGTSMASPHAAGLAALILSYGNQMGWELSLKDIRNKVNSTCIDINADEYPGYDYIHGFGRIDAPRAIVAEPEVELVVRQAEVFEAAGQGNGNYRPEAGETVSMNLKLMPLFADATGIEAVVSTSSSYITMITDRVTYPDTVSNEIAEPQTAVTFSIAGNCPVQEIVTFEAVLSCNEQPTITRTFNAKVTPARLLIWKDDRYAGTRLTPWQPIYNALQSANIPFEVFDTTPKINAETKEQFRYPWEPVEFLKVPTFEELRKYDAVIWYTGQTGQAQKDLASLFLPELVEYMDHGGNLMITSHELLYVMARPDRDADDLVYIDPDATPNPDDRFEYLHWFIYNYLHIKAVEHDNWYTEVAGGSGDPITIGFSDTLDPMIYNTTKEFNWWPDNMIPQEDAVITLRSGPPVRPGADYGTDIQSSFDADNVKLSERACGIRWAGNSTSGVSYRMIYLSYPLESMENMNGVLPNWIQWLMDGTEKPVDHILVDVETSQKMYTYNVLEGIEPYPDHFAVFGNVYNPGASVEAQRWMLLQIGSEFWCWPTYVNVKEDIAYNNVTIPSGYSHEEFLSFEWPAGVGAFYPVYFWFAHLTPSAQLLGDYDYCDWGFY